MWLVHATCRTCAVFAQYILLNFWLALQGGGEKAPPQQPRQLYGNDAQPWPPFAVDTGALSRFRGLAEPILLAPVIALLRQNVKACSAQALTKHPSADDMPSLSFEAKVVCPGCCRRGGRCAWGHPTAARAAGKLCTMRTKQAVMQDSNQVYHAE